MNPLRPKKVWTTFSDNALGQLRFVLLNALSRRASPLMPNAVSSLIRVTLLTDHTIHETGISIRGNPTAALRSIRTSGGVATGGGHTSNSRSLAPTIVRNLPISASLGPILRRSELGYFPFFVTI